MKKRLLASLLLIGILSSQIACGTQTEDPKETTPSSTSSEETTTGKYDTGLPDRDFGGRTFTFAVRGKEGDPYQWNGTDILAEEENGEALNDAVYKRNAYMLDKYNVKIAALFCGNTSTGTTGSEMSGFIGKSVMSGDSEFDAILTSPYDSIGYAANDYLIDIATVDHIDLTRDWWDQNANRELSMNGRVYVTTGELTYIDNKATQILLFSKEMVDQYKLDDPYETVKSGKWTLDKFFANSRKVSEDVDGNGVFDEKDRYGFSYWQDGAFSMLAGAGVRYGKLENGEPTLVFYNENTVNTWQKLISFISEDCCYSRLDYTSKGGNGNELLVNMLEDNRSLYVWAVVTDAITLRSSNADFGILPMPKYDEEQENYISNPHAYGHTMLTIPKTTANVEETGFILEAFSAKSMEIVTPAFYDVTLIGKSTRDDESAEMLDLIYSTLVYDIGAFFMWGGLPDAVMQAWNAKNENLASLYESKKAAVLAAVEETKTIFSK